MKILVLGAGATGGYFGGRMVEAGSDVTFFVRPRRQAQLLENGLQIRSRFGDLNVKVRAVTAETLHEHFDLILLSSKAYDLAAAMDSIAPAVGENTAVLPILNGMSHLTALGDRFGSDRVLGGMCLISASLDPDGTIRHFNDSHALFFGEQDGKSGARQAKLAEEMSRVRFDAKPSESIIQEMWEKWIFIASLAGITCLMRSAIGDIEKANGADLTSKLFDECSAIAAARGFPPRNHAIERSRAFLSGRDSTLTASMLRDLERGGQTEADPILGDLLRSGRDAGLESPLLRICYTHVKAQEARRAREAGSTNAGLPRP